jgi:hypothetical protein
MVWREQDPPATDVLLDVTVPFFGGGTPAYLELDTLPEGLYRATRKLLTHTWFERYISMEQ